MFSRLALAALVLCLVGCGRVPGLVERPTTPKRVPVQRAAQPAPPAAPEAPTVRPTPPAIGYLAPLRPAPPAVRPESRPTPPSPWGADRPAPPAVVEHLATDACRALATRGLLGYDALVPVWHVAATDAGRDGVEQDLARGLQAALRQISDLLTQQGVGPTDRELKRIADRGLHAYHVQGQERQAAPSSAERRRIMNVMLKGLIASLQQIRQQQ